jgi:predicted nucleic-acid-binding Zn-ribbon protein
MKNTNVCPKCNSSEIIQLAGSGLDSFGGDYVVVSKWTNIERVPITRYICASCGFSEHWVDSAEDLAKIVKRYTA